MMCLGRKIATFALLIIMFFAMVEYSFSRLCFKADLIEPLNENDSFAVHTPEGTFQMTKAQFYETFPNYVRSKSYKDNRIYHVSPTPQIAYKFLTPSSNSSKDLIGDIIRERIKDIAILWKESEFNPIINTEILDSWDRVIDEWIADNDMPLIIRKDAKYKGQLFTHPSGRKIIVSDNTFAIWVYGRVMDNKTYTLNQLKTMLLNNEIPMVYMQTKEIKKKGQYTKPLGAFSLPDWKVCHIEQVGFNTSKTIEELSIDEIKEHFKRFADPYNIFVLPKEIGDLGEIQIFIDEQRRNR